jgi:outer membrane receptor protein involved in Fe transport
LLTIGKKQRARGALGRHRRRWLLVLSLGAAGATWAHGDDPLLQMSIDQLLQMKVQTATKTATSLQDAPAVVTLITADDLARYGYESVADALAHVAGFIESDDRLNHNFGVRGLNAGAQSASRAIKILLDGQPIAFRSTQQQWTGLELIPMSMIERIEIVRGPVSVLYGADALLGAVNIITRREASGQRLTLAAQGAHGRHSSVLSASGGVQSEPFWMAWGVQGGHEQRGGLHLPLISPDYRRYAKTPSAPQDTADPRSLYLRAGWRGARDELDANLFWQKQDSDTVFSSLNPLLNPPTHVSLQQGFVRVNGTHSVNERQSLRASLSYSAGDPTGADRVRTGATDYYLLRAIGYRALDASLEWLWQNGAASTVLLGADLLRDQETLGSFQRHSLVDASNFQLSQAAERTLRNAAVYGQWQFPLTSNWQAIVGGRRDRHSDYGSQASLRAGVVGTLPGGWGLKLLGGTAFQAPSAELLYRTAVQPGDVRGNPDLAPQKARTVELQLSTPASAHWSTQVTVYQTRVKDLVTLEQAFFNLVARNSSDSRVKGLEVELRYKYGGLDGYLNVSHANSARGTNRYTLAPLAQRPEGELFPRNSANLGVSTSLFERRLSLSLDQRYVGARPAANANVLLANQAYQLGSYIDATLTARWSLGRAGQLRLQVRDLWNSRYVDPGVGGIDYPSLGRRYGVHYEYAF